MEGSLANQPSIVGVLDFLIFTYLIYFFLFLRIYIKLRFPSKYFVGIENGFLFENCNTISIYQANLVVAFTLSSGGEKPIRF